MTVTPSKGASLRADLHTHSTASDGNVAPAALIRQASERGLSILALTDHDTTVGLDEAEAAGPGHGVRVVPGIELSTNVNPGEVHILGYGIDRESAALQRTIEKLRRANFDRIQQMLERLRELGINLPDESIRPVTPGASVNRPHIARAMIAAGVVSSVGEAFDKYLGNGKPAYIVRWRLSPRDAIQLVAAAGGLPVLAHPFLAGDFRALLPELIDAGLIGIEVYYGEFNAEQRQELAAVADGFGLLQTGGSDYHGEGFRAGRELGGVDIPPDVIARFLDALAGSAAGSPN